MKTLNAFAYGPWKSLAKAGPSALRGDTGPCPGPCLVSAGGFKESPKPPASSTGSRGGLLWRRSLSFSDKWSVRRFHNVFLPGAAMPHRKINKQINT